MLPLNASSANNLKQIKGEARWWNWLVWEDMATKDAFSTKFIEISTMFEEEETSDPLVSQILVFSLKKFVF